jgi:biotin transport system substrate-specific component
MNQPQLTTAWSERAPAAVRLGVMCFGALGVAVAAQVSLRLPGIPVPFVLTPLVVVLVGLWLRPADAAGAMVVYLAAGATGLPVFAPGGAPGALRFLEPTAGFLLSYPLAAWTVAQLSSGRAGVARAMMAALAGLTIIDGVGFTAARTLAPAAWPAIHPVLGWFLALDLVKGVLAVAMRSRHRHRGDGATPSRHEA